MASKYCYCGHDKAAHQLKDGEIVCVECDPDGRGSGLDERHEFEPVPERVNSGRELLTM